MLILYKFRSLREALNSKIHLRLYDMVVEGVLRAIDTNLVLSDVTEFLDGKPIAKYRTLFVKGSQIITINIDGITLSLKNDNKDSY